MEKLELRKGYTTGSCMAAATRAAVGLLIDPSRAEQVEPVMLQTPCGEVVKIPIACASLGEGWAECGVIKDAGDDPDVTNGMMLYAKAIKRAEPGIQIECTEGIGRVTRKGLACAVGEYAINPVPRRMILEEAQKQLEGANFGILLELRAPGGEEIAKRTFNPRLGIVGGISILGTGGIVNPMSEAALIETIHLELRSLKANGAESAVLVPGNYGSDFARDELGIDLDKAVKISNYLGDALDYAQDLGFAHLTLIGHAGKLIKAAAGIMQTHSRYADGRAEVMACHTALCGGSTEQVKAIYNSVTVDDMLDMLDTFGIKAEVMQSISRAIAQKLAHRTKTPLEYIVFTNAHGVLCRGDVGTRGDAGALPQTPRPFCKKVDQKL